MINENFNSSVSSGTFDSMAIDQKKQKYINLVYPTAEIIEKQDVEGIEKLGLSALAGDQKQGTMIGSDQIQFVENLKFRIDARIVKNLKDKKKMLMSEMLETVVVDLGMHMTLPSSKEQMEELRAMIVKRADDLASRVHIKIEEPRASAGETERTLLYSSA